MTELYDALVALAEREHALVVAGAWEQLAALDAERRAILARLPAVAPASAAGALRRAATRQAQTTALLDAQVDGLRRELRTLAQGRVAVRGYGGGATPAAAAARPRLDLAG